LPFAGAGASAFRDWFRAFPESIEVHAVQLPGRESRMNEPCITSVQEVAQSITDAMSAFLREPFALFGYSMGALLAYEVAREIRRRGMPLPVALFVGAMRAPHLSAAYPPMADMPRDQLVETVDYYFQPEDTVWHLPELMDILLPILRDDFLMIDLYEYASESPLSCPVYAYVGADDRAVPLEAVEAWNDHAATEFSMKVFPGGHFFIHTESSALQDDVRNRLSALLGTRRLSG
jgi:surfactin synthase thioesterase subunit